MKMKNRWLQASLLAGWLVLLAGSASGASQYADSATTTTWDNGISALWGNGSGGPYDQLWASGNDAIFEGTAGTITIGAGGATAHNLSFATVSGYLITGSTLTLNGTTPTITNGPGVTTTISSFIAGTAGLTVEGAGTLQIFGGSNLHSGTVDVGRTTGTNTLIIGSGATFANTATRALTIGGQASGGGGNSVTVSSPGTATSATPTADAIPSFRIHGSSQVINVGVDSSNNTLTFRNGAHVKISGVTSGASGWNIGLTAGNNNSMVISDTNTVVTRAGGTGSFMVIGTTGTNNTLIVTNGGYFRPRRIGIGITAGGRDNFLKVSGPGSFLDGTDSQSIIEIGRGGAGCTNNYMLIENGAAAGFDNGATGTRGYMIGPVNGADYNYIRVTGVGSVLTNRNVMPLAIGGIAGQNSSSHVIIDSTAVGNHFDIYGGALAIENTIYLLGVNSAVNLGNGVNVSQLQVEHSVGGSPANTFYGAGVRMTNSGHLFNINSGRLIAGTINGTDINLVSGLGKVNLVGPAWIKTDDGTFDRAIASEITGSGSLTKEGTGKLLLTVSNSYSGLTTISNGTLKAAVTNSLGTGDLNITTGGKVEVPAGVIVAVNSLKYNGGALEAAGTYGATGSGADNINDTYFAGAGKVNVLTGGVPNTSPVAGADTLGAKKNTAATVTDAKLLSNDTDADVGQTLSVTAVSATSTNGGTVALSAGVVTYTPAAGYSGADQFTYTLTDSLGASVSGIVTVTVAAPGNVGLNTLGISAPGGGGEITIYFAGIPGQLYNIEASEDLVTWTGIGSATAGGNGKFQFTDVNAGSYASRYYRTVVP